MVVQLHHLGNPINPAVETESGTRCITRQPGLQKITLDMLLPTNEQIASASENNLMVWAKVNSTSLTTAHPLLRKKSRISALFSIARLLLVRWK